MAQLSMHSINHVRTEQHQSRHNERSRDHRDKHPYVGVRQPRVVSRVFVRSIHELLLLHVPRAVEQLAVSQWVAGPARGATFDDAE